MNTLEIRNIKTIEVTEISDVQSDLFNWSNRQVIITDKKGQEFTLKLYSDAVDKRNQKINIMGEEKIDECMIYDISADLHNDLLINFRNKKI